MATKHMAALEGRLGVRLLHRSTRRITLTEAGQRYLESAERILEELDRSDAAAAAERIEVTGTLRVSAPVSFAIRIGRLREGGLIARRLAPCRVAVAASPAYLAAHGTPRCVADLGAHNCLSYTLASSNAPDEWSFGPGGAVKVPLAGNLRANNGDALVAAAVAGQGIISQPTFILCDDLRAGRLVALDLDHPATELDGVFAVWPGDRRPPARLRAFLDWAADRFGQVPPWDPNLADAAATPRAN